MNPVRILRCLALLLLVFGLSACASNGGIKPNLARLYESSAQDPNQPPVILIHGLMGSTLVDAQTGKQFWPGSLSTLAFSDYRDLARMSSEDREGEGLVPGDLFYGVGNVDYYSALTATLEHIGRFRRGTPGESVTQSDRRRYYVLLYDWRKDNIEAVRKLHALIEQIRRDYGNPKQRVDIIAHSNGGLIANYYLRYGPNDVLEQSEFYPWSEGSKRIRRLVMLGTPSLGAVTSLERLLYGYRIALRAIPVEVMATFATPFEALPHPLVQSIIDIHGDPVDLNIYDDAVWRERRWSVFSPDVEARVRGSVSDPAEGERVLADLQATFVRNLHRALRFQWALTAPFQPGDVEIAVFGGDCEMTSSRAVLVKDDAGSRLVFRPSEARKFNGDLDFERLLLEPGDGLVTRSSQVSRETIDPGRPRHDFNFFPITQTFFLCEKHDQLTVNTYFQNNLLYFLLSQ